MTDHQHTIEKALASAERICEANKQRLTALRKQVLELIWQTGKPVGAYELLEHLKIGHKRAAPPTVYRAIEFLLNQGLIHRVASLNAFIACPHPEQTHLPEFLICKNCQHTEEIHDKRLNGLIYQTAYKRGFNPTQQLIEIHGQCAACQQAKTESVEAHRHLSLAPA